MKPAKYLARAAGICAFAFYVCGCGTTNKTSEHFAAKFRTTDGRTAEIGKRKPADGGWTFNDPHMNKCWLASGFDFNGYDTLLIMPTLARVGSQDPDPQMLASAKENIVIELSRLFRTRNLFTNIVTHEWEVMPGARVLKLENTITEFDGDSDTRYLGNPFGIGPKPLVRVAGKMTDGDKTVFRFELRRSGVSAGAHMAIMGGEDIQLEDIRSLTLDITDFVAAIAGKYPPKN
jgi:hypothetical protein